VQDVYKVSFAKEFLELICTKSIVHSLKSSDTLISSDAISSQNIAVC